MTRSSSLDPAELHFLSEFAAAAIEAARVRPGQTVAANHPVNSTGRTLIRPGGRDCYPAVWTQDFAMTLATGHVSPGEMRDHLFLIAGAQNGSRTRHLSSGAVIPPHAIADHVLFDGSPVFYPGTYSSGEDQGGEPWGVIPPSNNHYDFILIAWHLWRATGDAAFLQENIHGTSLLERLRNAFGVPRTDPANGLVFTEAATRAVGFIYCDSIYLTGHLLFASLLRWRAAHQLADLEEIAGGSDARSRAAVLRKSVAGIPAALPDIFGESGRIGGWLLAATETGRQPDVWGTIYALWLGLLTGPAAEAALAGLIQALEMGTILYKGALRHVPVDHDARPDSAWEKTLTAHNHYQNGAYWHTPSGWLIAVLSGKHPVWAQKIFSEMMAHFREEDFRKGRDYGAPWECLGAEQSMYNNPVFLGSVAVPCGVLCGKQLRR